jgi:predicted aspartyl protease
MKTIFRGRIDEFVPLVKAKIDNRMLVITEAGNLSMTVDTGFSGGIALPLTLIKRIGLKPVAYDRFRLGTGKVVDLPVFLGKVMVKNITLEAWFIPGDSLIGMEFLCSAGSILTLNLRRNNLRFTK